MQRHDQVRDADRFDDNKVDGAADMVTRTVFPMRLVRADVEIGEVAVAIAGAQRLGQAQP